MQSVTDGKTDVDGWTDGQRDRRHYDAKIRSYRTQYDWLNIDLRLVLA